MCILVFAHIFPTVGFEFAGFALELRLVRVADMTNEFRLNIGFEFAMTDIHFILYYITKFLSQFYILLVYGGNITSNLL